MINDSIINLLALKTLTNNWATSRQAEDWRATWQDDVVASMLRTEERRKQFSDSLSRMVTNRVRIGSPEMKIGPTYGQHTFGESFRFPLSRAYGEHLALFRKWLAEKTEDVRRTAQTYGNFPPSGMVPLSAEYDISYNYPEREFSVAIRQNWACPSCQPDGLCLRRIGESMHEVLAMMYPKSSS